MNYRLNMKLVTFSIFLVLLSGCFSDKESKTESKSLGIHTMLIQTDRDHYSPIMSSARGIGLSIKPDVLIDKNKHSFRWETNYGEFFQFAPPSGEIQELGKNVENNGETVFWSFSSEEPKKDEIQIKLTIKVKETNQIINRSNLDLNWNATQTIVRVK